VAVAGDGPRGCLGSGDGDVAGELGAAVAGDCAVGSGGCVGRPPTCEDDKDAIPTHTPKTTTAVPETLTTFSMLCITERGTYLLLSVSSTGWLRLGGEAVTNLVAEILHLVGKIAANFLSTARREQQTNADSQTHAD
jgi:hypothetical protein